MAVRAGCGYADPYFGSVRNTGKYPAGINSHRSKGRRSENHFRKAGGNQFTACAKNINLLGEFLGKRDMDELSREKLKEKYGVDQADEPETQSTNCGNNITYLLGLLRRKKIPFKSIILTQDASMQNRMDAGLRKYVAEDIAIINYAAYAVEIRETDDGLDYVRKPHGMWTVERYVDLLMGRFRGLRMI